MKICIEWDDLWSLIDQALWINLEGTGYSLPMDIVLGFEADLKSFLEDYKEDRDAEGTH